MKDYKGSLIKSGIKKTAESGSAELDFTNLTNGYYEINIFDTDESFRQQLAKTSFSIQESYDYLPAEQSYFGMNMHSNRSFAGWDYTLVKEAYVIGAMTVRDGAEWDSAETTKGKYNLNFPEFSALDNRGMDYLFVTGFNNPHYDNGATPYTDDGITGFANYSKAAFDYYPGKLLKHQEMFNEWYGPQFGDRGDGPADSKPETYFPLVKKVYETIKPDYPQAVLFGEFGGEVWDTKLFELGIVDYMDAAATHSYPTFVSTEFIYPEYDGNGATVISLRELLNKTERGSKMKIWLTETGYNTANNQYGVSEYEQAKFLPRLHLVYISRGADKIFWYDLLDDGNSKDGPYDHEYNFGLLRGKGNEMGIYTPKPAYVAYGVMTRAIDGKKYVNVDTSNGFYDYTFKNEDETLHCIYSMEPMQITLKTNETITITDIMGKCETVTPENGSVTLSVNDEVIYISGDYIV